MPLYDYECSKCGHRFEVQENIKAEPRKRCPRCRGKVARVISGGTPVLFRGNGFYCTDYRSDEYRRRAKEEGGPGTGSGSGPGSGSEGGKGS